MSRFARNVFASGLSGLMSSACQFSMQVLVVRALGLEQYGVYVAAVAVVSFAELAFLNRAGDLSMSRLSHDWFQGRFLEVRVAAAALERQDLRWTAAIFVSLTAAVLSVSKLVQLDALILIPLALSIPAQGGYGVSKTLLIISGSVQTQAKSEIAFSLTMLTLGAIGVSTFGIFGLVAAVVSTNLAKTLLARKLARAAIPPAAGPATDPEVRSPQRTNAESVFSVARSILAGAAEHTDTLLLNAFLGPQAAGIYRLAKSLASLPARVAAPMWNALRPSIARVWSVGMRAERFRVVAKPAAAMLVAMLIALPILVLYSEPLIVSLYGVDSAPAGMPFLVLLVGAWTYHGMTAWYRLTVMVDRAKRLSTAIFLGTFLWIAVLGALIGKHSPFYMACVVACAYVVTSILCWLTSFRGSGAKPLTS